MRMEQLIFICKLSSVHLDFAGSRESALLRSGDNSVNVLCRDLNGRAIIDICRHSAHTCRSQIRYQPGLADERDALQICAKVRRVRTVTRTPAARRKNICAPGSFIVRDTPYLSGTWGRLQEAGQLRATSYQKSRRHLADNYLGW